MNELYEYLKVKIAEMYSEGKTTVELEMAFAFRLYHLVCDMKHIRNIVNQEEDMQKTLSEIKK